MEDYSGTQLPMRRTIARLTNFKFTQPKFLEPHSLVQLQSWCLQLSESCWLFLAKGKFSARNTDRGATQWRASTWRSLLSICQSSYFCLWACLQWPSGCSGSKSRLTTSSAICWRCSSSPCAATTSAWWQAAFSKTSRDPLRSHRSFCCPWFYFREFIAASLRSRRGFRRNTSALSGMDWSRSFRTKWRIARLTSL